MDRNGRRSAAMAVGVILLLAASSAVGWLAGRRQAIPEPALPHAAPVMPGGMAAAAGIRASVLMYVDEECPFCRAELRSWARLRRSDPMAAGVPLLLVGPRPLTGRSPLLPRGLAVDYRVDSGGDVARALGVRAVPFTAYIDANGTVRSRTSGLTGIAAIRRHLHQLTGSDPSGRRP